MNQFKYGHLVEALPCSINVQLTAGSELQRCLSGSSPILLHAQMRFWKVRLMNLTASAQGVGWLRKKGEEVSPEEDEAAKLWTAALSDRQSRLAGH